jgi:hypothetical protein
MISKKLSLQVAFEMIVALAGLSACQKAPHEVPGTVLYEVMLREDEKHCLEFEEFPKALQPMIGLYQGDVFTTDYGDTLQLVCSYPNLYDKVNRYPFYFMRDNHGHYWTMYHEDDDKYHIYREDSRACKNLFIDKQKSLDELKLKD